VRAGFDTTYEAGYQPESNIFDAPTLLKLIVDLM
jgi:ketol-acid reductoisomerase